jgi:hypothetical protein
MTPPPLNPNISIPADVIEAAAKVSRYMESNYGRYWQLMSLCDRRYAYRSEMYDIEAAKRGDNRPIEPIS